MISHHKRNASWAALVVLGAFLVVILTAPADTNVWARVPGWIGVALGYTIFFVCWSYAKGKGYSGLYAFLLVFGPIGMLVLWALKDKHPDGL